MWLLFSWNRLYQSIIYTHKLVSHTFSLQSDLQSNVRNTKILICFVPYTGCCQYVENSMYRKIVSGYILVDFSYKCGKWKLICIAVMEDGMCIFIICFSSLFFINVSSIMYQMMMVAIEWFWETQSRNAMCLYWKNVEFNILITVYYNIILRVF